MKDPLSIEERMNLFCLEEKSGHRSWVDVLPFLKFPRSWQVQVIPNFAGSIIRFRVRKKNPNKVVSIYFDAYERLGYFGQPHWEIYPNSRGENSRFALDDTSSMMVEIEKALE